MTNKSGGDRTNLPFLFIIEIWEMHLAIFMRPNGKLSYYTFAY
jgi:hypothetical protein